MQEKKLLNRFKLLTHNRIIIICVPLIRMATDEKQFTHLEAA